MDKSQKIYCEVKSCKYNANENFCSLNEIIVTPKPNCDDKKCDESMCSSYKFKE